MPMCQTWSAQLIPNTSKNGFHTRKRIGHASADQKTISVAYVVGCQYGWPVQRHICLTHSRRTRNIVWAITQRTARTMNRIPYSRDARALGCETLRSHSALVAASINSTDSPGRESITRDTIALGIGIMPILHMNS
jgi:hypothetical protein